MLKDNNPTQIREENTEAHSIPGIGTVGLKPDSAFSYSGKESIITNDKSIKIAIIPQYL